MPWVIGTASHSTVAGHSQQQRSNSSQNATLVVVSTILAQCKLSMKHPFSVPVIAIFTKFDALVQDEFAALMEDNDDYEAAIAEAPNRAKVEFHEKYQPLVYETKYPPKGHVCLQSV
jgi:hypothetical protein